MKNKIILFLLVTSSVFSMDDGFLIAASSHRANKNAKITQQLIADQTKILQEKVDIDHRLLRIAEEQVLRQKLKGDYLTIEDPQKPRDIWINDMVEVIFEEREKALAKRRKKEQEDAFRLQQKQAEEECCKIF